MITRPLNCESTQRIGNPESRIYLLGAGGRDGRASWSCEISGAIIHISSSSTMDQLSSGELGYFSDFRSSTCDQLFLLNVEVPSRCGWREAWTAVSRIWPTALGKPGSMAAVRIGNLIPPARLIQCYFQSDLWTQLATSREWFFCKWKIGQYSVPYCDGGGDGYVGVVCWNKTSIRCTPGCVWSTSSMSVGRGFFFCEPVEHIQRLPGLDTFADFGNESSRPRSYK